MKMRPYLLVLLFLSTVIFSGCSNNKAKITIINNSGQKISEINIELNGKKQRKNNILPNSRIEFSFSSVSDSHYIIDGLLKDGTKFQGEFGYVTHGMDFNDTAIISNGSEIEFNPKSKA